MTSCSPVSVQRIEIDPDASIVRRYTRALQAQWDEFISRARNATFLFNREYMEYHSERFLDHSLMLHQGKDLVAVLPANMDADGVLASHDGLTYGGLVVGPTMTLRQTMTCFRHVLKQLHRSGITRLRYKSFPAYYNPAPEDDIAYCLFLLDAHLYRRDCTLALPLARRIPVQKRRIRQAKKAMQARLAIRADADLCDFWKEVLVPRLEERYGVRPVHSLAEITSLRSKFPGNIKQFSVYDGTNVLAGMTIYETQEVAHAQYIASTERGRSLGALDFLINWLLNERYPHKRYFDFGGSNEQQGRALNHGLVEWKEGFGARSFALDHYEILTANYVQIEKVLGSH